MQPLNSSSSQMLRFYIDRGRHAYRNRALGCYGAAAAVLAITIVIAGAEFYKAGPIVLVGLLVLTGGGFHLWYRSLSWARDPVLIALESAPGDIDSANVVPAHGKAALLDERQVQIRSGNASVMLTLKVTELHGLGKALEGHCPSARIDGFDAR